MELRPLNDAQTLPLLEAMGEWQAAYPLALNEARRANTVQAWGAVFQRSEYASYTQPMTRRQVYTESWKAAERAHTADAYQAFIALASDSVGAALAIDKLYQLTKQQDTVEAYTEFMAQFPGTAQSLEAMLRVHELVWQKVQAENTVAAYDRYLDAFPESKFAPEAEAAARKPLAQGYAQRLETCRQDAETLREEQRARGEITAKREAEQMLKDCGEDLARELFNAARKTNVARQGLRLYALLDSEAAFAKTRVMTGHLDRQERQRHQAELLAVLNQQLAQSRQQVEALLAALERNTGAINDNAQRLERAIQQQQAALQQGLAQVRAQIESESGLEYEIQRAVTQHVASAAMPWVKRGVCFAVGFIPVAGPAASSACNEVL